MRLPSLHSLAISAFYPSAEAHTTADTTADDEYPEMPTWREPSSGWQEDILRFLLNRAQLEEGVAFQNANGVAFNKAMLLQNARGASPFAPVRCTQAEYEYFEKADYFAAEGGIELYEKHLAESGVGALFTLLEENGRNITLKQAIARAKPRPVRLKLLFELLEGQVSMPESLYELDALEQTLHAVSGMRDPRFVNPEANNKAGNATNTGFEYVTIQEHGRTSGRTLRNHRTGMFVENGIVTRSFFGDPEIKACCRGGHGTELAFGIGRPVGKYLDDDFGSKDVLDVAAGNQVTFVTVNNFATDCDDSSDDLEGCMFFNTGQVYTSMSPRWTFKPE